MGGRGVEEGRQGGKKQKAGRQGRRDGRIREDGERERSLKRSTTLVLRFTKQSKQRRSIIDHSLTNPLICNQFVLSCLSQNPLRLNGMYSYLYKDVSKIGQKLFLNCIDIYEHAAENQ